MIANQKCSFFHITYLDFSVIKTCQEFNDRPFLNVQLDGREGKGIFNLIGDFFLLKARLVTYLGRKRIMTSPSPVAAAPPAELSA